MKYTVLLLLSVLFFTLTYASAPREFSAFDLGFLVCLLAAVIVVELLVAHLFTGYRIVQNLILALFAVANVLSVNLILNSTFIGLPTYAVGAALLLGLFILFTLMNMVDEHIHAARLLPVLVALATVGVLAQTLLSAAPVQKTLIEDGGTSAKNIRLVDFKVKPNVYFIAFDSIIPKVIHKKYLGIEKAPYHDVLDANFRRFKNFFADRVPTWGSLNSLLALDLRYFSEAVENGSFFRFFSGWKRSPLFEIFKHNGYETNTLYDTWYLGKKKGGPSVDNYFVNSDITVCEFIDKKFRKYTFFGYCALIEQKGLLSILKSLDIVGQHDKVDFLLEKMRSGLKKDTPQVFVAYIYSPGHTALSFNKKKPGAADEYIRHYLEASNDTAAYLNRIVKFIAKEDPDAIVFVFGDHGPYMSRKDTFEENPTFFVQDRFAVYGGIYPGDRCAESFSKPYTKDFTTVLQVTHMIIRCLSGGRNAFIEPEDYRLPASQTGAQSRYEDYLYE